MYSRNTDRGGRRIKLPPGYDGSAFRHETGELRRYTAETEMKIHSPAPVSEVDGDTAEEYGQRTAADQHSDAAEAKPEAETPEENRALLPPEPGVQEKPAETDTKMSFLEGLLAGLGSEEWLLLLVILLLVADGSDAWDVIVLLGLLLAVR